MRLTCEGRCITCCWILLFWEEKVVPLGLNLNLSVVLS